MDNVEYNISDLFMRNINTFYMCNIFLFKMVQIFALNTCVMIGIRQLNRDSVFIQFSKMIQYTLYYIT